jgi:hypothetical protein
MQKLEKIEKKLDKIKVYPNPDHLDVAFLVSVIVQIKRLGNFGHDFSEKAYYKLFKKYAKTIIYFLKLAALRIAFSGQFFMQSPQRMHSGLFGFSHTLMSILQTR